MTFHSSVNTGLIMAAVFNGKIKIDEIEDKISQMSGGIDFAKELTSIKKDIGDIGKIINSLAIEIESLKFENLAGNSKSNTTATKKHTTGAARKQKTVVEVQSDSDSQDESDDANLDNFFTNGKKTVC